MSDLKAMIRMEWDLMLIAKRAADSSINYGEYVEMRIAQAKHRERMNDLCGQLKVELPAYQPPTIRR